MQSGFQKPPSTGQAHLHRDIPKLYSELVPWWQLLSPASDYVEEAAFYWETLCGLAAGRRGRCSSLAAGEETTPRT